MNAFRLKFVLACVLFSPFTEISSHVPKNKDLSEDEHHPGSTGHNDEYDHDAFLGKGHGHDFDKLTEAESMRRLEILAHRCDKNSDGLITTRELEEWIETQRKRHMYDMAQKILPQVDKDQDETVSHDELIGVRYGTAADSKKMSKREAASFERDQRKFRVADLDGDMKLNIEEYVRFRHPEEFPGMEHFAEDEIMEELDNNSDQKVDLNEFFNQFNDESSRQPPEWVLKERRNYFDSLDLNKNSLLERSEVRSWAVPDRMVSLEEARHLVREADKNNDFKLTIEEVLQSHQLFVGSQATEHGESLKRHDEF